ncbi:unnamed protein product [Cylicocyclus nassatus]|uniref:HTH psq-type domain-containing protein n=1 Tax=Cylicocyclus nassatus TaxID=53992 RepID=A0AA36DM78_CYLNA|nr:unnamed protein product [Cylicocyclus nassatus]
MVFHVFEATVPPPPRENKARRGYYTRSLLCDAVKQAIFGNMTVTEASRYYKIPRTTIQKHVSKAREQHLLKEHYIRQMAAARRHQGQSEEQQCRLIDSPLRYMNPITQASYPGVYRADSFTTHWRQQPVSIDSSSSTFLDEVQCSPEDEMTIAEQCEVKSEEKLENEQRHINGALVNGGTLERRDAYVQSSVKPLTRIVLKREGKEDVVRVLVIPRC